MLPELPCRRFVRALELCRQEALFPSPDACAEMEGSSDERVEAHLHGLDENEAELGRAGGLVGVPAGGFLDGEVKFGYFIFREEGVFHGVAQAFDVGVG